MAESRASRDMTLTSGPWVGVRTVPEPNLGDATRLQSLTNGYIPDPLQGSGVYARPGYAVALNEATWNVLQGMHAHIGDGANADGSNANFFVADGKLYRWRADFTGGSVDVTPTNVFISPSARVSFLSIGDEMVVTDGDNVPWIASSLDATPVVARTINRTDPTNHLLRGTTDTRIGVAAMPYLINGTQATLNSLSGTALPAGTVPADQWAVYRVSLNTSFAVVVTAGAANYTTGYASEAAAIAAVPAVPSQSWNIGYFTLQTAVGLTFVAGTDALQGGASGNPANATNYYAGAADPWRAYGVPTLYYGSVFFIRKEVNAAGLTVKQVELTWGEPGLPDEGYQQTDYDNSWDVIQTSAESIYAIIGTNDALYYFRPYSIGALAGAPGVNFQGTATHDIVSGTVGSTCPWAIKLYRNVIYFADSLRRPYRFAVGGTVEPIWLQARALFEGDLGLADPTNSAESGWAVIEPTLNLYIVSCNGFAVTDPLVFDLFTGKFQGQWNLPNSPFTVFGSVVNTTGLTFPCGMQGGPIGGCTVWRLTKPYENVWQDDGDTVNVTVTTGWMQYSGRDTVRIGQVRGLQQYADNGSVRIPSLYGSIWSAGQPIPTQLTRAPNGPLVAASSPPYNATTRVVFTTDQPIGRGVSVALGNVTSTTQWKLWGVEVDLVKAGESTVEDI